MIKGYQSQKKTGPQAYATLQNIGNGRFATENVLIVLSNSGSENTIDGDSLNKKTVTLTAHTAREGDFIRFTSGSNSGLEIPVLEIIDANTIALADETISIPLTGDTFYIRRPGTLSSDSDGNLVLSQGSVQFQLNGSLQDVVEDTVTPANNSPLPVKLTSASGDINITAGDLNVQLSHVGVSADSTRIGDGVTELGIKPVTKEALVIDSGAIAELVAIKGLDFASQTTLAAVLAKIIAAPSTEAKQDTMITSLSNLDGKDYATQTTLAAVLAKMIASPATEAKQDTVIAALGTLNAKDFATQTTLASILAKIIAAPSTEAKQDTIITELGNISSLSSTLDIKEFVRHDFSSTNVTAAAYVELIASTSSLMKKIRIFYAGGEPLYLATGAAASESDKFIIWPGMDAEIELNIAAASRLSLKALSNTVSSGQIIVNILG